MSKSKESDRKHRTRSFIFLMLSVWGRNASKVSLGKGPTDTRNFPETSHFVVPSIDVTPSRESTPIFGGAWIATHRGIYSLMSTGRPPKKSESMVIRAAFPLHFVVNRPA